MKDFAEHYRRMAADSDFRFSEEFDCLKHVGRDQPCVAADLPVNRPKNRFTNILPYDHSRFKLLPTDDEEGSDYINSNYVPVSHSLNLFSNCFLSSNGLNFVVGFQFSKGVYCDSGTATFYSRRLLANDVGVWY